MMRSGRSKAAERLAKMQAQDSQVAREQDLLRQKTRERTAALRALRLAKEAQDAEAGGSLERKPAKKPRKLQGA